MIRIINNSNAKRFQKTLEQQFRLRHSVFVQERGWTEFEQDGIFERDQYDTKDTIYVVALDDSQDAIGCFRLYPTTLPHMLSETFPHLVDGAVIRRPDVMELTRFHLSKAHRQSRQYLELLTAIPEIGLELGMAGFTALARTLRVPIMQAAGLTITPIGLPTMMDGESQLAVMFGTDESALARINATRKSNLSVFEHNMPRQRQA